MLALVGRVRGTVSVIGFEARCDLISTDLYQGQALAPRTVQLDRAVGYKSFWTSVVGTLDMEALDDGSWFPV